MIVPLSWITEEDFVILNWLAERDIVTTPKVLAFETDIPHETIKHRLRALESHNLLQHPPEEHVPSGVKATGVYGITDLGKRVASGDMTIQEMRELEKEGAFEEE
jgi:DNA-binding HxlR family transcriptional regulator